MKLFILEHCPHCRNARTWISELYQEYPQYRDIPLEVIDEEKESDIAEAYDYYYVPCFFDGKQKLHEGVASKEIIQNIFDNYLRRI